MFDWERHALEVIRPIEQGHRRRIIAWTPRVLLHELGLEPTPRNRRAARRALEQLWSRGVLVRRREVQGVKATPSSPYVHEVAYSLPEDVGADRTTTGAAYDPATGCSLTTRET